MAAPDGPLARYRESFLDVLKREYATIQQRRVRAEIPLVALGQSTTGETADTPRPPEKLVGLALSGGGVRSGAVSIGFLQALYQGECLRHVDYLSTVSGGSYAGSYLSAALEEFSDGENICWKPNANSSARRLSLALEPSHAGQANAGLPPGSQSIDVRRMIHSGLYLKRIFDLFDAALFGILANWLMILSGIVAAAAALALFFRALDYQPVIRLAETLGFRGDAPRALLPATGIGIVWLLAHLRKISTGSPTRRRRWGATARTLGVALKAAVILAIVVVLNTGDIAFGTLTGDLGLAPESSSVDAIRDSVRNALIFAILLALVPFIRKGDLLRSGARPSRPWESWLAKTAGWAMIAGLPLIIFGLLVREDLFAIYRGSDAQHLLARHYVKDWGGFWTMVRGEYAEDWKPAKLPATAIPEPPPFLGETWAGKDHSLACLMWWAANQAQGHSRPATPGLWDGKIFRQPIPPPVGLPTTAAPVIESLRVSDELTRINRDTWFPERVGWLLLWLWPGEEFNADLQTALQGLAANDQWQDAIVYELNAKVLSNPKLYKLLGDKEPRLDRRLPPETEPRRAFDALMVKAKAYASVPDVDDWQRKLDKEIHPENSGAQTSGDRASATNDRSAPQPRARGNADQINEWRILGTQIRDVNRSLLELYYGNQYFNTRDRVFAGVVLPNDQRIRLYIFVCSLTTFLFLGFFMNVNVTTIHEFYRRRLADMWIFRHSRQGADLPLSALDNASHGGPYHIINATVHFLGPRTQSHQEPTGCFIFSQHYCGNDRVDYEDTKTYEKYGFTLADAMAISGAALTPLAGFNNPLLFYAMLLANARLGQWVPNPGETNPSRRPAFIPALLSYFRNSPERSSYLYVSDGGFHDNSGIETLLRRRCRLIVALDATSDANYQFLDLLRVIRRMQVLEGVQFEWLQPNGDPLASPDLALAQVAPAEGSVVSTSHFELARITYPQDDLTGTGGTTGYLLYVKSSLTRNLPPEVLRYKQDNPAFPHDTTLDQFFEPRKFECYRALGWQMGQAACKFLGKDLETFWASVDAWEKQNVPEAVKRK